jgi:hypothetical protein
MLKYIEELQDQGVDIHRVMFYQDKYQALYSQYDNAAKNKVRKEEFEQNVRIILNDRPYTMAQ